MALVFRGFQDFQEIQVVQAFPNRQGSQEFLGRQETRERQSPESRLEAEQNFPVKLHVLQSIRNHLNEHFYKCLKLLTPGAGRTSAVDLGGFGHTGQHSPSGVYISVGLNMLVYVPHQRCS